MQVKGLLKTCSKMPVTASQGLSKVLCSFCARASRINVSLALLVRASRPFIACRVIHTFSLFSACYTGFVPPYTKDAIISVLLFYASPVLKEFFSYKRILETNYLQMLTENRSGEIVDDFKKIYILNSISVVIFFSFLSGVSAFN